MSERLGDSNADPNFGIESHGAARIRQLCDTTPGLKALWIFASRARGDHRARSDIDFEADAPNWSARDHVAFTDALKHLPIVYPVDCVWRQQAALPDEFRDRIARDRRSFWSPHRPTAEVASASGGI